MPPRQIPGQSPDDAIEHRGLYKTVVNNAGISAQYRTKIGATTDAIDISGLYTTSVLYTDGLKGRDGAKGLLGAMWYEDHLGPGRLEARADGTLRGQCQIQYSALDRGPPPGRYNGIPCPRGGASE